MNYSALKKSSTFLLSDKKKFQPSNLKTNKPNEDHYHPYGDYAPLSAARRLPRCNDFHYPSKFKKPSLEILLKDYTRLFYSVGLYLGGSMSNRCWCCALRKLVARAVH